jgi:hypothetical protein
VGLGTILGTAILFWYDGVAPRLSAKHPTKREEYLRLPLVCASGPVYVASMLWLGWSARPDIHWFVPLASMVPYGLSYHIIYVAVINVSALPSSLGSEFRFGLTLPPSMSPTHTASTQPLLWPP